MFALPNRPATPIDAFDGLHSTGLSVRRTMDGLLSPAYTTRNPMAEPVVEVLEEPSLLREIGKIAWMFGKVVGVVLAVSAALIPLFRWNAIAGMCVFWGLVFAGQIILMGYWNYKSRKKDLEWKRKWREDEVKWNAASKRLYGDKSA
jgi:hypothetical protein